MKEFSKSDYETAFRYMNVKSPTALDIEMLDNLKNELLSIASPKYTVKICNATKIDGFYTLENTNIVLNSEELNKCFENVEKIGILAVTLGLAVDKKIAYFSATNMLKAIAFDALSSVMVENIADEVEFLVRNKYSEYKFCMRYSCGYGDLPLTLQEEIIEFLDAKKLLGISVNDANLMTPQKSITAFLGLSKNIEKTQNICKYCHLNGKCVTKCRRALDYGE